MKTSGPKIRSLKRGLDLIMESQRQRLLAKRKEFEDRLKKDDTKLIKWLLKNKR